MCVIHSAKLLYKNQLKVSRVWCWIAIVYYIFASNFDCNLYYTEKMSDSCGTFFVDPIIEV